MNAEVRLTAMIFPVWAAWFCTLVWGCICFPLQNSNDIAHSYSDGDDFSGRAGVPGPQTSNELQGVHASRTESSVFPQSGLVHRENSEDASSATSLGEEMVQSKLQSGYRADDFPGVPSASSVQTLHPSGHRHPFELLLRDSQHSNHLEGVSFPTVNDFKHFVEILKSSYLMPGGDLTKHFQTAREMIANEARAQYAQAPLDAVQRAAAAESGSVYGWSENEVHSEPQNTALFEQSEQGGKYEMGSESPSVSDPEDSASNLFSTSHYDQQDRGNPLSFYAAPRSAAQGINVNEYEGFDNGLFSGENPTFTNGPNMQREDQSDVQSDKMVAGISGIARSKSLNSYGRIVKVTAPKTLFNVSDYLLKKPKERPTASLRLPQPTNGKKSEQMSEKSVYLNSHPLPQSRTRQAETLLKSLQNEVLNRKKPTGSHDTLNVKRTNNRNRFEELLPQNPDQRVDNSPTPNSVGQHSAKSKTYFPVIGNDATSNIPPNFLPPKPPQMAFSNLFGNTVMSRSSGFKSSNPRFGIDATRNMLVSFLNWKRGGFPQNRATMQAIHAGILDNFMKRSKLWKQHPHSVSQRFGTMAYQMPVWWLPFKFMNYSTRGGIWPKGGKNRRLLLQSGHRASASSENSYVGESKNNSVIRGDHRLQRQEGTGASRWKTGSRPSNDRRASTQTP